MADTKIEQLALQQLEPLKEFIKEVVVSEAYKGFTKKKVGDNRINDETKPCIILKYLQNNKAESIKIPLTDFEKVTGYLPENANEICGSKLVLVDAVYLRN